MAMNFLACDREQPFLMPPDPRDWLPEEHLAWFVLASVEQMDLSAFYSSYRVDGWGRAAFEPSMMVSLSVVRVREGRTLVAGNRAQVRGGCRLPGDRGAAEARSRDDRKVPCPPRGRAGRAVRQCAWIVQTGGAREGRGDRDRRNEGARERLASLKPRLRAARTGDPQGGRGTRRGRGRALRGCSWR